MTRKRWIAVGVSVLLLGAAVAFIATRARYVNTDLAIAAGNQFFSLLQARNVRDAAEMYDARFRKQHGEVWDRLLANLDAKPGPVTKATLAGVQIVPIDEVGCVLLQYQVSRGLLASTENLVLCPARETTSFVIAGHELTRLDTQQNIAAGVRVQLKGVRLP
jgi:hypothetical protein